jgi:restriction endonuclease S subunit
MSSALEKAALQPGDLLLSRSNTRELVGLPAVFDEDRKDVSYPDTMMRLSFDKGSINNSFMEMCLRSPNIRREVQSYAAGTSSSMKKINGTNLCKVRVPDISLAEQDKILSATRDVHSCMLSSAERQKEALRLKAQVLSTEFALRDNS